MNGVNQVEDQRLIDQVLKEMEQDAAILSAPVNVHHGKDHAPDENNGGVQYQKCGGGRRVIRKQIGGA